MQAIDMTPTWAAIMPAFIAALQCGTPEGQAMAREELSRLAASVDAQNARVRSGAAEEERNRFGAESVALGRERAATDLARAAEDFRATGAHDLAAAYFEAAARIAPAALAHDLRVAGGLEAARASSDLRRALQEARESGAAEALPEAQAARAEAMRQAHAEGRRAGREEARAEGEGAAVAACHAALAALTAPNYGDSDSALDHAGDARQILESFLKGGPAPLSALLEAAGDAAALLEVATGGRESLDRGQARATIRDLRQAAAYFRPAPVQNSGAAPAAKEEGAAQ